ncbi:unnamed protein product [Protopolystoma xenopodis]|uniref:Uncharacterized protein n=1 Tax=Protopolystoma xenopodis TaxID=117903 RepID=A0A3S5AMP5_9PLAT|nr:unnamed protein product [Protopolystoma xenopodis]
MPSFRESSDSLGGSGCYKMLYGENPETLKQMLMLQAGSRCITGGSGNLTGSSRKASSSHQQQQLRQLDRKYKRLMEEMERVQTKHRAEIKELHARLDSSERERTRLANEARRLQSELLSARSGVRMHQQQSDQTIQPYALGGQGSLRFYNSNSRQSASGSGSGGGVSTAGSTNTSGFGSWRIFTGAQHDSQNAPSTTLNSSNQSEQQPRAALQTQQQQQQQPAQHQRSQHQAQQSSQVLAKHSAGSIGSASNLLRKISASSMTPQVTTMFVCLPAGSPRGQATTSSDTQTPPTH